MIELLPTALREELGLHILRAASVHWLKAPACWHLRVPQTPKRTAPDFEVTWNGRTARYRNGNEFGIFDGHEWSHFKRYRGEWFAWAGRWVPERKLIDELVVAAGEAMTRADQTSGKHPGRPGISVEVH